MITGSVISGSSEDGLIVHTPLVASQSALGMLNLMVSAPDAPAAQASTAALVLAAVIASRNVQLPLAAESSSVVPTVMVAAWAGLTASSSSNNMATIATTQKARTLLALPPATPASSSR